MKKVLIFALTIALALGGLGFAHGAVTRSQDDLVIYPIEQTGDASVLEGLTASMTFACGDHLRWHTDHTFGGGTVTEFSYHREPIQEPYTGRNAYLELGTTGGVGASITGGSFTLYRNDYGAMLRAVAAETPEGGSKTMSLSAQEYISQYLPDYDLYYSGLEGRCSQSASLSDYLLGMGRIEEMGAYNALMNAFRFPVQPGHTFSATVEKDAAGLICSIELYPENGPQLRFLSDVTDEGVWFVPIFTDEQGAPLPYQSPAGHGVYHIPWKIDTSLSYGDGRNALTLDVPKARRLVALEETVPIAHMELDAQEGKCWMLTVEGGSFVLTIYDLSTGEATVRTEILPLQDLDYTPYAQLVRDNGYLLVTIQEQIALLDEQSGQLLLTAPDVALQIYSADNYDPHRGDLRFDGETLILLDTGSLRDGAFWTAAYRQDQMVCYGLYDCSLMQDHSWYYSYITTEQDAVALK